MNTKKMMKTIYTLGNKIKTPTNIGVFFIKKNNNNDFNFFVNIYYKIK